MQKSIFYSCRLSCVCVSTEQDIINLIGEANVEVVHLGEDKSRMVEAENAGIKSVPA
jgi:glutaredoxin 3